MDEHKTTYPDKPLSADVKHRFRTKAHSEHFDPCAEAAKLSMKCLDVNGYDKKKCADFFQSYRDCKLKWTSDRKRGNW